MPVAVAPVPASTTAPAGAPQLRCPADNRKVDDPILAVPADAAEVQQALRARLR
jgi:hypothetical protein